MSFVDVMAAISALAIITVASFAAGFIAGCTVEAVERRKRNRIE